jgi:ribosome biogenesis SPOUT family RNA methylase Rps3
MKYIIEHLDKRLYLWNEIEYKHASKIVGRNNIIFTNLNKKQQEKLSAFGAVKREKAEDLGLAKVCILDPLAKETLEPKDAKQFDYLVIGGLLGDFKIDGKTKKLLTFKAERRNLGKKEMPTDTAVLAAKMIVDGMPLEKIRFQDGISIDLREGEAIDLDYRYILKDGKPILAPGFVDFLKKRKTF